MKYFVSISLVLICACSVVLQAQVDIKPTPSDTSKQTVQKINLGPNINSIFDELLPIISPDGKTLYFCRNQSPENIGGGKQDIWYSELQADGSWGLAKNMGAPLNNRDNNFLCSITPDGNTIIVADAYSNPRDKQRSVAIARRTLLGWTTPVPLMIKNFYNTMIYREYTLSNDSKVLIMAVERQDTRGGKDLYVSFIQPDSTWSEPVNLGDMINSVGNEATPFIASDGRSLYFSSDGQGGYGAFDVFVARRLDDTWTNWTKPENLGPEINTNKWDLYYSIPAKGDAAFYVSYENTFGVGDIFTVKLPEKVRPRPVVLVTGRVLNKKGEPIEANIIYELLPSGAEAGLARSTPASGEYKIVLPSGDNYGFRASAPGFIAVNDNMDLRELKDYSEIKRDLYLVPIEDGSVVELKNIFFDYNQAVLREESLPELRRIAELMKESPTMTLRIEGHTDNKGTDNYNQKLSEARANSVATQITTLAGTDATRITAVGFGEHKPVATNDTDEGRALNRRVEIVIVTK